MLETKKNIKKGDKNATHAVVVNFEVFLVKFDSSILLVRFATAIRYASVLH